MKGLTQTLQKWQGGRITYMMRSYLKLSHQNNLSAIGDIAKPPTQPFFLKMEISSKRAVIQYMQLKGHSPKEIRVDMFRTLKYQAPSYATVKRWCNEFNKFGKTTVEDEPRPERPRTVNCEETVLTGKNRIMQDRRVTTRDIADELGISNDEFGTS